MKENKKQTRTPKANVTLKCPLEYEEGIALVQWASLQPIIKDYLIHIPNEGRKSWIQGKQKKAEGVKKGVSDYFLAFPTNGYHGLWIELKRRDKKETTVTEHQTLWIERMRGKKYRAEICYGWQESVKVIEEYLHDAIIKTSF